MSKNNLSRAERRRIARENFKKEVFDNKAKEVKEVKKSKSVLFLLLFLGFNMCFLYAFIFGLNLWVNDGFVKYIGWAGVILIIASFIYTWIKKRSKTSLQRGSFFIIPMSFVSALLFSSIWVFSIDYQLERKKFLNTLNSNSQIVKQLELVRSDSTIYLDCDGSLKHFDNFVNDVWEDDTPATKKEIDLLIGSASILYASGCSFDWNRFQNKINLRPIMWEAKSSYKTSAIYKHLNLIWPKQYRGCQMEVEHHLSSIDSPPNDLKSSMMSRCSSLQDKTSYWPGPMFFNDFDSIREEILKGEYDEYEEEDLVDDSGEKI